MGTPCQYSTTSPRLVKHESQSLFTTFPWCRLFIVLTTVVTCVNQIRSGPTFSQKLSVNKSTTDAKLWKASPTFTTFFVSDKMFIFSYCKCHNYFFLPRLIIKINTRTAKQIYQNKENHKDNSSSFKKVINILMLRKKKPGSNLPPGLSSRRYFLHTLDSLLVVLTR